jgi:hypothetical protein
MQHKAPRSEIERNFKQSHKMLFKNQRMKHPGKAKPGRAAQRDPVIIRM